MIKNELIRMIRDQVGGMGTKEIWIYITFIIDEISQALDRGESVKITNFGVFEMRNKKERLGRNPRTLEEATISARRVVRFRPSEGVTELINGKEKREKQPRDDE